MECCSTAKPLLLLKKYMSAPPVAPGKGIFFQPGANVSTAAGWLELLSWGFEQLKAMQATIPMNRLGTPDECAGTFVYLASDAMSGYVTGQVIEVNGGQYMP